jgi:hypothetical protein
MKNENVVVRLRPMGELLKKSKRDPVIPGRSPRDFAESARDIAERVNRKAQRANTRAAAWAFVSGMGWAAFVVIAFYQLTGGA